MSADIPFLSTRRVPKVAIGLLHYPILDQEKRIVATNITNFDIHDIARAATVYGVDRYYLIHPNDEQLMFVERVLEHWRVGNGAKYNPSRKTALEIVKTAHSLEAAIADWGILRKDVLVVGTHARLVPGTKFWSTQDLNRELQKCEKAGFLLFGTGFGMTDEYMGSLDGVLESLHGAPPRDFRHFSVRSAVSIYLDRVLGPW